MPCDLRPLPKRLHQENWKRGSVEDDSERTPLHSEARYKPRLSVQPSSNATVTETQQTKGQSRCLHVHSLAAVIVQPQLHILSILWFTSRSANVTSIVHIFVQLKNF